MGERAGPRERWWAALGPGILLAATGVGAGDLATAGFTGARLGTTVLWAVLLGAAMKYALSEGIARWQLATDSTVLEGASRRLGRALSLVFLPYLMLWSFFVGAALMSACGVTLHAIWPVFGADRAPLAKVVFGALHSGLGLVLVLLGGFALFEKVMSVCIALMFTTVVVTAALLWPGAGPVLEGLVPDPSLRGTELEWVVALTGGVGGTVTILCYGYWIRVKGRRDPASLPACRIDLAAGYSITALFGLAMVVIGSQVEVEGSGATLVVQLADRLEQPLGTAGRWAFLIGAWGAVFSSLLGVWQAVPYLFADAWGLMRGADRRPGGSVDVRGLPYRAYLYGLATVPCLGLVLSFQSIQKLYAIVGALFLPLLAVGLLLLNGRAAWVGQKLRNRLPSVLALGLTLAFFGAVLWLRLGR